MRIILPVYITNIIKKLNECGFSCFLTGGAVRDFLSDEVPGDFDLVTSALPGQIKEIFSEFRTVDVREGTVVVAGRTFSVEISTLVGKGKEGVPTLKSDLSHRDFTVNAMAFSPDGSLVDPYGGLRDLKKKRLRTVGSANARFKEDGLRVLRALRFMAVNGFAADEKTDLAIHENKALLKDIAPERINAELSKLVTGKNVFYVLMNYSDVLGEIIPEITPCVGFSQYGKKHAYDVWEHICHTVETVPPDKNLRLAMLLHDLGKIPTHALSENGDSTFKNHAEVGAEIAKKILIRLRFDKKTVRKVTFLVKNHDFEPVTDKAELLKIMKKRELSCDDVRELLVIKKSDRGALAEEYRDIGKPSEITLGFLAEIEAENKK